MCLGNHDHGYSNKCLIPQKNAFNQVKYTQKSDKWMMPFNYYNFTSDDKNANFSYWIQIWI